MKTFRVKFERVYTTYVTIEASSESEAYDKFESMMDDGLISEKELEQMNIGNEDVTIDEVK